MEGAYLHWCQNNNEWVRSWKVSGRSFLDWHKEHLSSSKLTSEESQNSKFYSSYPSKDAPPLLLIHCQGFFHNLIQCVGLGICLNNDDVISKFCKEGQLGVFLLPKDVKQKIQKMGMRNISANQKVMHFNAYLAELAYDLAISKQNNISTSPGFEICLLSFHK